MDPSSVLKEPLFLVVVSSVGGGAITYLVTALLAKSASFRYSFKTERIGITADDPVFGAVRVQWRDTEVRNLYLITYEVENASAKDFENVALTIYTSNNTMLLGERPGIVDTPDHVPWSPSFQERLAVPPGETLTADQLWIYNHRREYLVPVLNRGQKVRLQYVCTRPQDDLWPDVFLNVPVKGIRLVHQRSVNFFLGVPVERAVIPGMAVAVLIWAASAAYLQSTWLAATLSLLAGLTVLPIGALVYKARQKLWRKFFG